MPLGALIDTDALLQVVLAALVAGIGATALFSVVIYSAARSAEVRREGGSRLIATLLGVVAAVTFGACLLAVFEALRIMTTK